MAKGLKGRQLGIRRMELKGENEEKMGPGGEGLYKSHTGLGLIEN